jgi:hypothetical protein
MSTRSMKPPAPALCAFLCLLVLPSLAVVHVVSPTGARAETPTRPDARSAARPEIGHDPANLPSHVREMRDAILAAVRTGAIDELKIPIQWNELPPDFGPIPGREAIERFKAISADGEGREILATLGNLLSAPYTIVREGPDIENNQVYVWPHLSRLSYTDLTPTEKVLLLSIAPPSAYAAMKATGRYTYWSIVIGADGTWHSFKASKPSLMKKNSK